MTFPFITDPSEAIYPPLVPPADPLALLTDAEVTEAYLILRLGCGKNKVALKKRQRKYICAMFELLGAELDRRHLPKP